MSTSKYTSISCTCYPFWSRALKTDTKTKGPSRGLQSEIEAKTKACSNITTSGYDEQIPAGAERDGLERAEQGQDHGGRGWTGQAWAGLSRSTGPWLDPGTPAGSHRRCRIRPSEQETGQSGLVCSFSFQCALLWRLGVIYVSSI